MTKPGVRLALIGANNQGKEHLIASTASVNATITCVAEHDDVLRLKLERDFSDVGFYSDWSKMLDEEPVDGVIMALPHDVYEILWDDIIERGKPILKEKPLARNLAEAHQFLTTAHKRRCGVVTAIQRREHPSYIYLKDQLRTERILTASATLHLGFDPTTQPAAWRGDGQRAGGGALLDSGYHMVDLVSFLVGPTEVVSCNCWFIDNPCTRKMLETEATLLCRSGGAWVQINSKVGGDDSNDNRKMERIQIETQDATWSANRSMVSKNAETVFECEPEWNQAMVSQLDRFAERISNGDFDDNSVWEQLATMQVIETAYGLAEKIGPVVGGY